MKRTAFRETSEQETFRKRNYLKDAVARKVVFLAGVSIIVSIVGIFLFLVGESFPLMKGASVNEWFTVTLPDRSEPVLLTGTDVYREVAYVLTDRGRVHFMPIGKDSLIAQEHLPLYPDERLLSAAKGVLDRDWFAVGTNKGRIITGEVQLKAEFRGEQRIITTGLAVVDSFRITPVDSPAHVEKLVFRQNEDGYRFWAWETHDGQVHLRVWDADMEEYTDAAITPLPDNTRLTALTMDYAGEKLVLGYRNGLLQWFDISDPETIQLQFEQHASTTAISALQFLIGDAAVVVGDADGNVNVWSPVPLEGNRHQLIVLHAFQPHKRAVVHVAVSSRNRSFLTADADGVVHLNYSTTDRTQSVFQPFASAIQAIAYTPKTDGIIAVSQQRELAFYQLDNPHPEVTLKTLFGKVWYENYPKPDFVWQSTGGTDAFEPKLSLVPLIFGTFKGTLYAMLFSVPIALLAAIYVSQFAPRWLARIVKPTLEIMAILPSVVIGMLGGLFLAPLFEQYLMSLLVFMVLLPLVFLLFIVGWRALPEGNPLRRPMGWELMYAIPLVVVVFLLSVEMAPLLEQAFFHGDLRQWIVDGLKLEYDTRNSLVVGFALGFAVIPIIFTVAEDALSNVPDSLISASLALGASRWQTVQRVVIPAAMGGIFAGIMLGFGRAVGETMIVLMATGNTPVIDLNPFNGFRAMSACIAVEIPEAPVGGTLYRVLFLTGLLLFAFTFVINLLASLIGERFRKKYARF